MRPRIGLGVKLSSLVLVMMLSCTVCFTVFILADTYHHVEEETENYSRGLATVVGVMITEPLLTEDYPVIEESLGLLLSMYRQIGKIEIQRADGRTVTMVDRELGNDVRIFKHSAPILIDDSTSVGVVSVSMGMQGKSHWSEEHLPDILAASVLLALLVSFLLLFYIRRIVISPLGELVQQAERIGHGDLSLPIVSGSQDELGLLAQAMEIMRNNLNQSYQAICQQNDELDRRVEVRTVELQEKNRMLEVARDQLVQAEKMAAVGILAAGVAHEINNPVSYLSANLTSLEEYVDSMDDVIRAYEQQDAFLQKSGRYAQVDTTKLNSQLGFIRDDLPEMMAACHDGVQRIGGTVSDLMFFSRNGQKERELIDVHECLESTLKLVRSEISSVATLVRDYQSVPKVRCVPSQINQVFLNLLINAIQSLDGKGEITVSTRARSEWVEVRIRDNGRGISKEERGKIFDPFYSTKTVGQGTGLGLSVSWDILHQHNGSLLLDHASEQGACFIVKLPFATEESAIESSEKATALAPP